MKKRRTKRKKKKRKKRMKPSCNIVKRKFLKLCKRERRYGGK